MEEAGTGLDQPFVADHETTEMTDPRERPPDDPASTVASPLPAILVRGVGVTGLSRNDRFDPASHEPLPQRVGVVPVDRWQEPAYAMILGLSPAPAHGRGISQWR